MKHNRFSRTIAPLSAICMSFALAGCEKTPPTSELKIGDTTYTLMTTTISSAPPVYLHAKNGNVSTSYMFNKSTGYTASRYTSYFGFSEFTMRRSFVATEKMAAAVGSKEHTDMLGIGCTLAKSMMDAPTQMTDIKPERLAKDRVTGTAFFDAYCKPSV